MLYAIFDGNRTHENLEIHQIFDIIKSNPDGIFYKIINDTQIKINNLIVLNTLFICHRINSSDELNKIHKSFGVELDLRDDHNSNKLILAHDPYDNGEYFENYLQHYNKSMMILNIKSERIEFECINLMEKHNITNYFFLDSTFPMIYTINKKNNNNNFAIRYSEYEDIHDNSLNLVKWVWIDCFTKMPLIKNLYDKLCYMNKKICIVSPELHGHNNETIQLYKKQLSDMNIIPDAICCKSYNIIEWI